MTTAASGEPDARPPVAHAAPSPGAAVRPTALTRPLLPVRTEQASSGFPPDHPYVRRYWVAAIGAGAVVELLRLIQAGRTGRHVPLPRWLPALLRAGLVRVEHGELVVASLVPEVPTALRRRFPPGLRESHRRSYRARSRP